MAKNRGMCQVWTNQTTASTILGPSVALLDVAGSVVWDQEEDRRYADGV